MSAHDVRAVSALVLLAIVMNWCTGCATTPDPNPMTNYPGIFSVKPPVEVIRVGRPTLAIHVLSTEQLEDPSIVVKGYLASLMQMIRYAESLEEVLDQLQKPYSVFDADPFFDLGNY